MSAPVRALFGSKKNHAYYNPFYCLLQQEQIFFLMIFCNIFTDNFYSEREILVFLYSFAEMPSSFLNTLEK